MKLVHALAHSLLVISIASLGSIPLAACEGSKPSGDSDLPDSPDAADTADATSGDTHNGGDTSTSDATSAASVNVVVPPETPAGAVLEVTATPTAGAPVTQRVSVTSATATLALQLPAGVSHALSVEQVEPTILAALTADGAVLTPVSRAAGATGVSNIEVPRWGPRGGTTAPSLVLLATVPANTPDGASVRVSGNQPLLGDWDGVGLALWRTNDGRFATRVDLPLATALEFKFTRGSWATVEKGPSGEEIANRAATISQPLQRLELTIATWADLQPVTPPPGGIDLIEGVTSEFLMGVRNLIVYLPPGYETDTARSYPVLYMHDGQNLMDAATSAFGVEWRVDETAEELIGAGKVEPVIIVGVNNTGARMDEYTPVADAEYGGGKADAYGRFLVEEVKPLIDSRYRTVTTAAKTGLAGSSLGGLVSMYLGMEYPDVFGRLGVISPSVWWANRDILDRVEALSAKLPLYIWLDIGTAEGSGETVEDTRLLRDALIAEGWVLDVDLDYGEYPGAAHNEAAWAERFDDILESLYPAP